MNSNPLVATFLFTDLENSTPLWEKHPEIMPQLAARHDALLRQAIKEHRGQVVKSTGDGFFSVFELAKDAVAAALVGQQVLNGEPWPPETGPFRVRMGLHTGESREREGDYYGAEVNRAARVMGIAHGGQILLSGATAALMRTALPQNVTLMDLGLHRLRGLAVPEEIFQVCHQSLSSEFPPLKSLSTYRHNLPVQLSTFIGRETELANIQRLLNQTHLLTLLGPGGTGKTRLMLEVGEEVVGQFRDGVWFVELAALTDPDMIAERVAAALFLQPQPGRGMLESLTDYLRHKELLILLDNVEHLIRECAEFAEHLLIRCPKLKFLVTGREALFISGEITLQIPSLSLVSKNGETALDDIRAAEGVQLFVARVQDVHPSFELSQENAHTIADIVRRLDGIPLALELAAARTRMLSVEQIAERLNDRFRLLTGGRRTALPRQQTLQALIDWSWNLLVEKERLLLQRLSVFSGGWSIAAAQAVTSDERLDEYEVFDGLEQLVNKSLVMVKHPASGRARYGMLESIRQYGRDRLFESGEGEILRDRHAAYYVAFAEEAEPHLVRSTMLPWVDKILLELDNLRSVQAWTMEDQPELALRIGAALLNTEAYWLTPREAQSWLEPAVKAVRDLLDKGEADIPIDIFIKGLIGLGFAYGWQGNAQAMHQLAYEAAHLARSHNQPDLLAMALVGKFAGDPFGVSPEALPELKEAAAISIENNFAIGLIYALGLQGMYLFRIGKVEAAIEYLEEAITHSQKISNPRLNASIFTTRSLMSYMLGELEEARYTILTAIDNYQAYGDQRGVLVSQSTLAHILRWQGKIDEAEIEYRQTIVDWQAFGQPAAVSHQIECFAYIAIAHGDYERAARLIGAAKRAREELKNESKDLREIADMEQAMEQLTTALGAERRDQLLSQGSRINLDDAVLLALEVTS